MKSGKVILFVISALWGTATSQENGSSTMGMEKVTDYPEICSALPVHYCYGELLPYRQTSKLESHRYLRLKSTPLRYYERFRYYPACWSALQPVLCGLRFPKCEVDKRYVLSRRVCDLAKAACSSIAENVPSFLSNCSDSYLFNQEDANELDFSEAMLRLPFNKTDGLCPDPLVRTNDPSRFYPDMKSCGMRCQGPFLSAADVNDFHIVILILAVICVVLNVFAMVSIILKLKTMRPTPLCPDKCILFMNVSFLFSSIGYLVQFIPTFREMATCTEDGLQQMQIESHPAWNSHTGLCLFTFFTTYIFTLSALIWFGHLMFACFLDFRRILSKHKESTQVIFPLTKSSAVFFHGSAWLLPAVPAVAMVFLHAVEGNNLLGVCWIAPRYKSVFLLAPFAIVLSISFVFIILYAINLRKSRLSDFGAQKTQRSVLRRLRLIGVLCIVVFLFLSLQAVGMFLIIFQDPFWADRLWHFVQCQVKSLTSENPYNCSGEIRLVRDSYLGSFYAMLLPYFFTGMVVTTWTWNGANVRRWKAFFNREKPALQDGVYQTSSMLNNLSQEYDIAERPNVNGHSAENTKPLLSKRVYSIPRHLNWRIKGAKAVVQQQSNNKEIPREQNESAHLEESHEDVSEDAKRFQRPSIIRGQRVSTVADFSPHIDRLENWQERAMECRLQRRKSDAGPPAIGADIFKSTSHAKFYVVPGRGSSGKNLALSHSRSGSGSGSGSRPKLARGSSTKDRTRLDSKGSHDYIQFFVRKDTS
ncbi:hypothetical protein RvY_15461 [Ramazzottius varieornatus]|uniref:G-protein coupled receptors family 2 profile 2 domain-containing protein n=1 Tax=Ramazzottius varieornatus TaxID=947166 RepID=A0A1D1VV00_RAMVA|nr:hypothetical protein RvY_15461 [Ramazzottius varieornatus]